MSETIQKSGSRKTVLRMVEMPPMEQSESDAFLRRIAVCKSPDEIRELIEKTREFYQGVPAKLKGEQPVTERT